METKTKGKKFRGENWNEMRNKCYERDNSTCRKCGSKQRLAAHHIIPYIKSKDNSLTNLITLCNSCHTTMENKFRRFGVTRYVTDLIEENKVRI